MLPSLRPTLYIRISPERLTVRNVSRGEEISEIPEMAISYAPKEKIVAVGSQARMAAAGTQCRVVNPFAHPRSLVSDFTVAEHLLKAFIRRLQGSSLLRFAPLVVMHPLGKPAGGFTQVENRAFEEMAAGAGAAKVILWQGRDLTDQDIHSPEFPSGPRFSE